MDLVNNATGKVEDVPNDKAAQAFLSGTHGVQQGQVIHTKDETGQLGTVAPEHLAQFLRAGGTLASPEEVHQAQLQRQYGGVGGTLAAGGEAVARGLTVGLSDPLAVGAARLFGGDKAAESVRQHLANEKEANPYVSTGGEILGAAAPLLLSGGAAAPLEGAEAAAEGSRVLGSVGEGVRTLGAIPRGIDAAGQATERLMGGILGATSDTAIGRAAQSAARTAARAAVESGLWSAGSAISDATIQDHELTAEKLLSAVGHGALVGGAIGGALGGAGKLASEGFESLLGGAPEKLADARGQQAWKWLDPSNAASKQAIRQGGTEAVGNTVYREVLAPLAEEGLTRVAIHNDEKLDLVRKAIDTKGQQISSMIAATPATVKLADVLKPIDDRMIEFYGKIGQGGVVTRLKDIRDDVIRVFGGAEEVSAADLIKQRRSLQDVAYKAIKTMNPAEPVQQLREVTGEWNRLEERALNEASREMGGTAGTDLRAINKTYAQLKVAETALENNTARYATNRNFSLTDYMMGAAHAPGLALRGHPIAALGALSGSVAHHALRDHGNAYAALMLDRLASMGGVAQAAADVDRTIDRSIDKFLSKGALAVGRAEGKHVALEDFNKEERRVRALAALTPALMSAHLQQQTEGLQQHLPTVANAVEQKSAAATKYLANKLPPSPLASEPSLTPQLLKPKVSDPAKASFLRSVRAVNEGAGGFAKRLASGELSSEDVEAAKLFFPKTYQEMRQKILAKCADRTKPLAYDQRKKLGLLFDIPTDPTLSPIFIAAMQDHYQAAGQPPAGPAPQAAQKSKQPPAKVGTLEHMPTAFEQAQAGGP